MTIYLHPFNETSQDIEQHDRIEIDLISWDAHSEKHPVKLTLVRKLNQEHQKPCLQELMFKNLYENLPINELTLEIPCATNTNHYKAYKLHKVNVINYSIYPKHSRHKHCYEKILLTAHSKKIIN